MRSSWDRRVIPRWRSSTISAMLFENLPTKRRRGWTENDKSDIVNEVSGKIAEWRLTPTLGVAADLLNYAHIQQVKELLKEPAAYIHQHAGLAPQILSLAKSVLGLEYYSEYGAKNYLHSEISRLKKHLRFNPRDAVAYVDLARHYVVNKQSSAAEKLIFTALALEKDNRFVLRSASRFYLHLNDPDRSLKVLARSERTKEDPWLLASMIAVETILDKSPEHFKRAKAMIEGERFAPVHLAELGAALATLQLNEGHLKNARRLFNASLNNPNDNAVAQAVWAANEFSMNLAIDPGWLSNAFSSEASYYSLEKIGDYRNALKAARDWFEDEPFSIRPLQAGAFVASICGEFSIAEDFVRQALLLEPTCVEAKNNLIFALIAQNKIDEALILLNDVCFVEMKNGGEFSGHTLANRGMLSYRLGDIENGYKNYRHSVAILERTRQFAARDVAMAYWVQEALLASDPKGNEVFLRSKDLISRDSLAANAVLKSATGEIGKNNNVGQPKIKSTITWEHDKKENVLVMKKSNPFKI